MIRVSAILAFFALFLLITGSSSATTSGTRTLTVTSRVDATGVKTVDRFTVAATDRVYITRTEAEVIHADGTSTEVVFAGRFGNATLSKEKP